MAVFAFLLYFYTVMVIEKKTKFSTESTKIRYFDLKIKKNPREGALPPLQTPLWGGLERDTPSPQEEGSGERAVPSPQKFFFRP